MTLLERLAKLNFKRNLLNKEGSLFIEASIVMPLACIIAIAMIQLAICFFNEFASQVAEHKLDLSEKSYTLQIEIIRNYGKFFE